MTAAATARDAAGIRVDASTCVTYSQVKMQITSRVLSLGLILLALPGLPGASAS
jgi:hypothetical protein